MLRLIRKPLMVAGAVTAAALLAVAATPIAPAAANGSGSLGSFDVIGSEPGANWIHIDAGTSAGSDVTILQGSEPGTGTPVATMMLNPGSNYITTPEAGGDWFTAMGEFGASATSTGWGDVPGEN